MAKRIGKSKVPLAHQFQPIVENLRKKLNKTVFLGIQARSYNHDTKDYHCSYVLSIIPGFGEDCTRLKYRSWPDLLKKYFKIMKKEA